MYAGTATLLKVVSAFRGKKHTVLKQSRIPIRRIQKCHLLPSR
ncbi:germinal center-associated signaling and motility protein isoform X2 [Prionailurus iriomotensis]